MLLASKKFNSLKQKENERLASAKESFVFICNQQVVSGWSSFSSRVSSFTFARRANQIKANSPASRCQLLPRLYTCH